ncbi:gypsy retrotransposon integrase-like protein 1 [Trichonephila clavipes]|nr:gypsy retrotransposon integrase-like protein 1 [Trichonephila clavipes]
MSITAEEQKCLEEVPAQDEMYEEKEEISVDMIKDRDDLNSTWPLKMTHVLALVGHVRFALQFKNFIGGAAIEGERRKRKEKKSTTRRNERGIGILGTMAGRPQVSNYFINGEGLLCHLSKRPSGSPSFNTTRKQVCIPHCLKARILESIHSEYGGHLKFFKTYHRLSENFIWQTMYENTKNFVRSCTVCLSRKNAFKIPPAPHQPVEQSQEPGETCHIDIFGPLKTTPKGKSYVLSMIDAFTKYIHIVPLLDIKSSTNSKAFFDNYIVHRGCRHKLVVDNAAYFKSYEFVEFCRVMGIHKRHISSYSAHVNGRVEKPNQSLANILASISQNTNDWDEQLPHTMLALNSAIHEATYTSPFFLEHGRDIRLSYTYEKNSDTPQNKYEYVEKLLPSLELIF